jgi:CMP/dCMP kinase
MGEVHLPGAVIAIDGPAGSGKSTAARQVAIALGLRYLDTGAMYRALTWWLQEQRVDLADTMAVLARIAEPRIEVGTDPRQPGIAVDGRDVAGPIRTRQVSNSVSTVAAIPQVRAELIAMQRDIIAAAVATGPGIVAEGRDIGTVVAPGAPVKVYLTASDEARSWVTIPRPRPRRSSGSRRGGTSSTPRSSSRRRTRSRSTPARCRSTR